MNGNLTGWKIQPSHVGTYRRYISWAIELFFADGGGGSERGSPYVGILENVLEISDRGNFVIILYDDPTMPLKYEMT